MSKTDEFAGEPREKFLKRREAAREKVDALDGGAQHSELERKRFFNAVYEQAEGDAAMIPWADMKAKPHLLQWLADNPGINSSTTSTAIDVACGLGDNAEAIAAAGYATTAFDLSPDAIEWAKKRHPSSPVAYHAANLYALPSAWQGAFDLVNECYTLQSMPPETIAKTAAAIAGLVAPSGTLLIYARIRPDDAPADGPPWPIAETSLTIFASLGLVLTSDTRFEIEKRGRIIPHAFMQWRRPA